MNVTALIIRTCPTARRGDREVRNLEIAKIDLPVDDVCGTVRGLIGADMIEHIPRYIGGKLYSIWADEDFHVREDHPEHQDRPTTLFRQPASRTVMDVFGDAVITAPPVDGLMTSLTIEDIHRIEENVNLYVSVGESGAHCFEALMTSLEGDN